MRGGSPRVAASPCPRVAAELAPQPTEQRGQAILVAAPKRDALVDVPQRGHGACRYVQRDELCLAAVVQLDGGVRFVLDPARRNPRRRQRDDEHAAAVQPAADRLDPLLARLDALRRDPGAPAGADQVGCQPVGELSVLVRVADEHLARIAAGGRCLCRNERRHRGRCEGSELFHVLVGPLRPQRRLQVDERVTADAALDQELDHLPFGHAGCEVVVHIAEVIEAESFEVFVAESVNQETADVGRGGCHASLVWIRSPLELHSTRQPARSQPIMKRGPARPSRFRQTSKVCPDKANAQGTCAPWAFGGFTQTTVVYDAEAR